jgi:hypothetical protein
MKSAGTPARTLAAIGLDTAVIRVAQDTGSKTAGDSEGQNACAQ